MPVPAPAKSAPAQSPHVPTDAPLKKAPPGAPVLLERRRAEVQELEAAWTAKRQEVEQYLANNQRSYRIEVLGAEAAYQNARLAREVAEIGLTEYEQGISKQIEATLRGNLALAVSNLMRAEDGLNSMEAAYKQGNIAQAQLIAATVAQKQAIFRREQAETQLKVLESYTKPNEIARLKSNIEKGAFRGNG